ncbi:hypothetical protein N7457_008767 [Penicillium paradoxum]|uniref:uncharacterized protein n=1 Tax=Penicillium paradoxum TaxID=176176 RepID=UPI002549AD84|nr:uncharacterized protein N7457_008767 [Penicillium paradoxum]KAJ5773871.1 hypothetical protein N7457_008767 [Penicillium paradoxum]
MDSPAGSGPTRQTPSPTTPLLFTLPAEIRFKIYGFCIPRRCAIKVANDSHRPWGVEPVVSTRDHFIADRFANTKPLWTSILHVCKQMSEESLDILYGDNLFEVHLNKGGETTLKKAFSQANLQRIRYLIAISPGRWYSGELNPPDVPFWPKIIPNLVLFEWITQLDSKARRSMWDYVPQEHFEHWLNWTNSYLECFGELVAPGTKFRMGVGDEMGTYRKVGQLCFRRGPFFDNSI